MTVSKENQASAEAHFHKAIKREQEAKQAMSQYEADARAVNEKTAKLRALRLAKEAAEALAKEAAEAKEPARKKKAVSKEAAGLRPEQET